MTTEIKMYTVKVTLRGSVIRVVRVAGRDALEAINATEKYLFPAGTQLFYCYEATPRGVYAREI